MPEGSSGSGVEGVSPSQADIAPSKPQPPIEKRRGLLAKLNPFKRPVSPESPLIRGTETPSDTNNGLSQQGSIINNPTEKTGRIEPNVTRRKIFKKTALSLTAAAAGALSNFDKETTPPLEKLVEVKISEKLSLLVLPVDHDKLLSSGDIQALAGMTDGAILEYSPEELKRVELNVSTNKDPKSNYFYQLKDFFTSIQDAYFQVGKPIYDVDPVQNINFGIFRTNYLLAAGGGGAALANEVRKFLGKNAPRRDAIKYLGLGAVAAGASQDLSAYVDTYTGEPNDVRIESNFRRCVTPEALHQLGELIDQQSDKPVRLLMVEPPVHWKAIEPKLADLEKNKKEFNSWRAFFRQIDQTTGSKFEQSFFTIRMYQQDKTTGEVARNEVRLS